MKSKSKNKKQVGACQKQGMQGSKKCEGVEAWVCLACWRNHRVSDGAEVKLDG